jgi:glycosyltransferase involved in cell wall biosynthesis
LKVTIITVCKNAESTIEKTMRSVIDQDFQNIEYIIIDGVSNDLTTSIISKYQSQISFFIQETDQSLYEALNKGLKLSTGDIIGFLHAGDVFFEKVSISKIINEFKINKDLDALYSDVSFVNEHDKSIRLMLSKKWNFNKFSLGLMPPHPGFYCKRTAYVKSGFFSENYKIAADFELLIRLFKIQNFKYKYLPQITIKMKTGGISNRGFISYLIKTREIKRALDENKIKSSAFLIFFRFILKINQYIHVLKIK